ncbi:MAG TPA: MBL fold metallo-hydrolase [Gemmatimonadaceae bacterium]
MIVTAACASLAGAPAYHGPKSDHFDGKYFHNYVPIADNQIEDAVRNVEHSIQGKRGYWTKWEEVVTDSPPPRVGNGELRVTFVNHSTVLIQTDSINILTDPIWSKRASPFSWIGPKRHRPPGIRFEDLPPIDIVLLSHNHYDHLDLPTLRRLVARFHPRIVAGLGNARWLAKNGVPGADDIDWWQTIEIRRGVRVSGVPAQHWSARSLSDEWRTLWLGFVIETPTDTIYYAGDTGYAPFFPEIRDRFGGIRLAILPIAPQRPRRAMAARHMSASDAVRVAEELHAFTALAVHFGTFQQGDDSEEEPVDSLAVALGRAEDCAPPFWALRNGAWKLIPPFRRTAFPGSRSCNP